jgi:serine/threonine-protein kinase Chk1
MEYLEGGDLFAFLEKRDFRVSEKVACSVIHQIATALYFLHGYGIAHRDLKPENVMLEDANADGLEGRPLP